MDGLATFTLFTHLMIYPIFSSTWKFFTVWDFILLGVVMISQWLKLHWNITNYVFYSLNGYFLFQLVAIKILLSYIFLYTSFELTSIFSGYLQKELLVSIFKCMPRFSILLPTSFPVCFYHHKHTYVTSAHAFPISTYFIKTTHLIIIFTVLFF